MTDAPTALPRQPTDWRATAMERRLRRRYASERRFRALGIAAILLSVGFLAFLMATMAWSGARGFMQTELALRIDFPALQLPIDAAALSRPEGESALAAVDFERATRHAAEASLGPDGPAAISESGWLAVRDAVRADPTILSRTATVAVPVSPALVLAANGEGPADARARYAQLKQNGLITRRFSMSFLTGGDATDANRVGIWSAFKGSLLTMLVTLILAFPVGVLSAIYLEEYAPRNRWTDLIEVSINNLAAVPSIIFGLLGLAILINTLHLPRSSPLVAGMTLALMTMPVIVIAARNAIKAVPPSVRDAALGIGASPVQVVFHHVLPLALPGILTGTIIAMSRALGETAPLLMVGLKVFVTTPPDGITDPATVLPMQIFLWSDEISRAFIEKTSAAIIVLLVFLLAMNGIAIYLRDRFETRW